MFSRFTKEINMLSEVASILGRRGSLLNYLEEIQERTSEIFTRSGIPLDTGEKDDARLITIDTVIKGTTFEIERVLQQLRSLFECEVIDGPHDCGTSELKYCNVRCQIDDATNFLRQILSTQAQLADAEATKNVLELEIKQLKQQLQLNQEPMPGPYDAVLSPRRKTEKL